MIGDAMADWHMICLVVADQWGLAAETEAALHGFQKFANGFTAKGNFNLHALVSFVVDEGVSLAAAVVNVLGYVNGALMAFGA